jgi:hypothetical protein
MCSIIHVDKNVLISTATAEMESSTERIALPIKPLNFSIILSVIFYVHLRA